MLKCCLMLLCFSYYSGRRRRSIPSGPGCLHSLYLSSVDQVQTLDTFPVCFCMRLKTACGNVGTQHINDKVRTSVSQSSCIDHSRGTDVDLLHCFQPSFRSSRASAWACDWGGASPPPPLIPSHPEHPRPPGGRRSSCGCSRPPKGKLLLPSQRLQCLWYWQLLYGQFAGRDVPFGVWWACPKPSTVFGVSSSILSALEWGGAVPSVVGAQ